MKPVQLRNGKPAIIYHVYHEENKIHGAANFELNGKSDWRLYVWTLSGHAFSFNESPDDLINIPEKPIEYEMWVNCYPKLTATACHETKERANLNAGRDRIACLKVKFVEGEGL